ncbi:Lrp/AsnC family transcriptional regulator [Candidatus Woesearchaeota archaeon]|nr:Lrp/AsnC family transcriptional regulator [Candidatus Woesearchaeota archaeon]
MDIDKKDKAILNTMLENSRLSYRQIAKKTGMSVATVMHRVNALEEKKIIKKYTALFDYEQLNYDITVIIEMQVSKGKLENVEKKIAKHPNVVAVYDVTGAFDIIIIAKFKTRKAMDVFLKEIQTYDFVLRTNTQLVLKTMKEEEIFVQ